MRPQTETPRGPHVKALIGEASGRGDPRSCDPASPPLGATAGKPTQVFKQEPTHVPGTAPHKAGARPGA